MLLFNFASCNIREVCVVLSFVCNVCDSDLVAHAYLCTSEARKPRFMSHQNLYTYNNYACS